MIENVASMSTNTRHSSTYRAVCDGCGEEHHITIESPRDSAIEAAAIEAALAFLLALGWDAAFCSRCKEAR